MASVLHRQRSVGVIEMLPPAPDSVPSTLLPPDAAAGPPAPWPTRAKVTVAVLVVATMVAAIVAAIGVGDNGSTPRELRVEIEALTVDRDDALVAAGAIDVEVVALRRDLEDALEGNDALNADVAELQTQLTELTGRLADSVAAVDASQAALVAALATTDSLKADVAIEQARLAAAVTDRNAVAALFPMKFSGSLTDVKVVGKYSAKLTQVYCTGLASCGSAPARSDVSIRRTKQGFLRIDGPGFADVGMFQADGALHAVAGSTTALPKCDGSPRTANITMTMFPSRYEIAKRGARTIAGVTAVLTVQAPAIGTCPAALASYSSELTPKA